MDSSGSRLGRRPGLSPTRPREPRDVIPYTVTAQQDKIKRRKMKKMVSIMRLPRLVLFCVEQALDTYYPTSK